MRTTIELTNSQRALLLRLAAERGEKGFSTLVQEAIDRYLEHDATRKERGKKAIAVGGTMSASAAEEMEASVRAARRSWR